MTCSGARKVEDDSQLFSCDRKKENAWRGMGHAKGAAAPCMQEIYWGLIFREKKKKNQRSIEGQYRQRDKLMYATGHRLHGKLRVSIPSWCEWRQALGLVSVTDLMWTCPREVPYLGVWKLLSVEDTSRGSINCEFSHIILCYLGRDS